MVKLVGRADVDDVDIGVVAKLLDGGVRLAPDLRFEPLAGGRPPVRRGQQPHARIAGVVGQKLRRRFPQAATPTRKAS